MARAGLSLSPLLLLVSLISLSSLLFTPFAAAAATVDDQQQQRCKSVPGTSTISVTSTVTVTTARSTQTITFTSPAATVVSTSYYEDYPSSPSYITVTASDYDVTTFYKTLAAKKTVTVATPKNFTAVRCETAYVQPRVTQTTYTTQSYGDTEYKYVTVTAPGSTTTVTEYVASATASVSPYTTTVYRSTSTTSTLSQATTTRYDACATNNVVNKTPLNNTVYTVDTSSSPYLQFTLRQATSALDCCNQCQAAGSTCAFSIFGDVPQQYNISRCTLYLLPADGSQRCDGSLVRGLFSGLIHPYENDYISNGPCGQVDWRADY